MGEPFHCWLPLLSILPLSLLSFCIHHCYVHTDVFRPGLFCNAIQKISYTNYVNISADVFTSLTLHIYITYYFILHNHLLFHPKISNSPLSPNDITYPISLFLFPALRKMRWSNGHLSLFLLATNDCNVDTCQLILYIIRVIHVYFFWKLSKVN